MKQYLYLSIGSNIEPAFSYLSRAISMLDMKFTRLNVSPVYKTEPVDDVDQNYFLNICVKYETEITDPFDILTITSQIEKDMGRVKEPERPKGPRIIDIDILLFGDMIFDSLTLTIPHKSMFNRNFVLIPLKDIYNDKHPRCKEMDYFININKNVSVDIAERYKIEM